MTIDQLKKHVFDFPDVILKNANSIYVYGSVARNDADEDSDCDVFICTNYHSHQEYLFLKKAVSFWESEYGCEFSLYQMDTLQKMWENGSYFLWHIKKEGILLYQQNSEFQNLLNSLPSYRDTKKDFEEYAEILKDIEQSVAYDNTTLVYELSVLAILARNICIGCCYLLGNMDFGRKTPIIKCNDFFGEGFPFSISEYNKLYQFRLASSRGKKIDQCNVSPSYVRLWIDKMNITLHLASTLVR